MLSHILVRLSRRSAWHWAAIGLILSLAMLLRVKAFQGYAGSDPGAYTALANDLSHGIIHLPGSVFSIRVGVYGPPAMLMAAFGLSEATIVAYPFILGIGEVVLAYAFAGMLFCPLAGLLAAACAATVPLSLTTSSLLYPDLIGAFWGNIALFSLWGAVTRAAGKRRVWLALLAGLLFGVSWLCKASVIYLAPFCLLLVISHTKRLSGRGAVQILIALGCAAAAVLCIEALVHYQFTGDALYRVHETGRNCGEDAVWFFNKNSPMFGWEDGGYAAALRSRLLDIGPRVLLLDLDTFGPFPLLAVLAIAYAINGRLKAFFLPAAWFASLLLLFNFGSISLHTYQPLPPFPRYFHAMIMPATVLCGGLLSVLLATRVETRGRDSAKSIFRERLFWGLTILAITGTLIYPRLCHRMWTVSEFPARKAASMIEAGAVVYTDSGTVPALSFFRTRSLDPMPETKAYETAEHFDFPTGSYVLIDRRATEFGERYRGYELPAFVDNPPATWDRIWHDARQKCSLYRVGTEKSQ